jgi:hypothetical protein
VSGEIDDLYVVLRAVTAPAEEGFVALGATGERMAETITAATTEVTAATERMAGAVQESAAVSNAALISQQAEYERLAATVQASSAKMEAATAKAAKANEALGASMTAEAGPVAGGMKMAKSLALAGAGVAIIGVATVHMAADFESSTNRLVTSAGEIHSNLEIVRRGMLDMAGEVGYSAEKLSDAMYTVESGSFHGAAGLTVLRAAAEGAKAENADLKEVADAVTSALIDYHLPAEQAASVTSKLVAATSMGKTTFQELTSSMSQILPVASAAHVSLDDILGDLASMTVHGMSAQQSAQNLADVIRHMQAPTDVQAKELALLGLTTNDLSNSLSSKGLSGTLEMVSDRIRNFMPPGSQKVIMDMGNALNRLPPAVQELGGKLIDGTISMKEYTKAAKDLDPIQAKQAMSFATLAGSTHRIGDEQVSGAEVMQTYGAALAKATGDATGLRTTLMLTGENMGTTKNAIHAVAGAATEAGNHVKGWHDIQSTFNQKMSEAKAGMGALAISVGEKLLPAASALFDKLAIGANFLAKHQTLATVLAIALGVLAVGFTIAAIAVWAMNSALLANPITWIVLAIVAAIAILIFIGYELYKHWGQIWGFIKDIALDVWHWLVKVWNSIAKEASHIWNDDIVKPIKKAWDSAVNFLAKSILWFEALPGKIGHALTALPGEIGRAFQRGVDRMFYLIGYGIGTAIRLWHELPLKTWKIITELWDGITSRFVDGYHAVLDWIKQLPDRLAELWMKVYADAKAGWDLTIDWLLKVPGRVEAFVIDMYHRVTGWVSRTVTDVGNWLYQLPGRAWSAFKSLVDTIWGFISNLPRDVYTIGQNIVEGLIHGIESAISWAVGQVKRAMGNILQGAKDAIGAHSPSRVFADEVGRWIPHGIAEGIKGAARVAKDAVAGLMQAVTPKMALAGGLSVSVGDSGSIAPTTTFTAPGGGDGPGPPAFFPPGGGPGGGVSVGADVHVYIDGTEVRNVTVKQAQRNKLRNGDTLLT